MEQHVLDEIDLFADDAGLSVEELPDTGLTSSWGSVGTFGSAFGCASTVSTGSSWAG